MLIDNTRRAPKSSARRSREFRARNPHYHREYRKRRAAEHAAWCDVRAEAEAAPLFVPVMIQQGLLPAPVAPVPRVPLALPAPSPVLQLPLFTSPAAEPVPLEHPAAVHRPAAARLW